LPDGRYVGIEGQGGSGRRAPRDDVGRVADCKTACKTLKRSRSARSPRNLPTRCRYATSTEYPLLVRRLPYLRLENGPLL